jgi:hypothetical protein
MPVTETQLVDDDVVYCSPGDVFAHIRNKKYADLPAARTDLQQGGLTKQDVDDLIFRMSGKTDTFTKRAWRTRKVVEAELDVKFSHKQKHARHRRRKHRKRTQTGVEPSSRAKVTLPHNHVKDIDGNEGDVVEILNERDVNDVTTDEGRADGSYVLSNRKGVLKPDVRLFTPVSTTVSGQDLRNGEFAVRVSYRYGFPHNVTDYTTGADTFGQSTTYSVSTEVRKGIRDATAMLVVARLIAGDQYGELLPNSGDDSPDLSTAANQYKTDAKDELRNYRRA